MRHKHDSQPRIVNSRVLGIAFLAALVGVIPFLLFHISGDVVAHYFNMQCVGNAFWQGNLYPRWCMQANDQIGSPALFFYFPLAYFISSIFYPLTLHTLTIEQLYIAQLLINHMVTFVGCQLWFRPHISFRASCILALFYLWFPYRSELVFYRSALAELWAIALIPYVMWALEKVKAHHGQWPVLSVLFALMILAHAPASAVLFFAIALMFVCRILPASMLQYTALALCVAMALSAIYWFPAVSYAQFVSGNAHLAHFDIYPNRQPVLDDVINTTRNRPLLAGAASFIFCIWLALRCVKSPTVSVTPILRRQAVAGLAMAVIAAILLLPISAPLWNILNHIPLLAEILLPWRFQALWLIGSMLLTIVFLRSDYPVHHWKVDVAALGGITIMLSTFMMVAFTRELPKSYQEIFSHHLVPLKEYRTVWQKSGFDINDLRIQIAHGKSTFATIVEGQGTVSVSALSENHIMLQVEAKTPLSITLRHLYFPSWVLDNTSQGTLAAHPEDGLMELRVLQGVHRIGLTQHPYRPEVHPLLPWLPGFSLLLWCVAVMLSGKRLLARIWRLCATNY